MIASISKIIYEAQASLGIRLEPKGLRIDFKNEKRFKDLIDENFQKPHSRPHYENCKNNNYLDDDMFNNDGDMLPLSHKRSSLLDGASAQDHQDEDPLMQSAIMLRRGRCGRLFAKYIQKSIFEDSDGGEAGGLSDNETAEELEKKVLLKKRRKRYQELQDCLDLDGVRAGNELFYQGLLLRDQKYLKKHSYKLCQLSVKESTHNIVKRHQQDML